MRRPTAVQLRALVKRFTQQFAEPTITRPLADEIFKMEPPTSRTLTTLSEKVPIEGVNAPVSQLSPDMYKLEPRRMAYDEALGNYLDNPHKYEIPYARMTGEAQRKFTSDPNDVAGLLDRLDPQTREAMVNARLNAKPYDPGFGGLDTLHITRPGVGTPEDIGEGLGYERQIIKPFKLPSSLNKTLSGLRSGEHTMGIEDALTKRGVTPEDLSVSPEQFLKSEGEIVKKPEIADMVQKAMIAEALWQESMVKDKTDKIWKQLRMKQKPVIQASYRTPKDYFLLCFNQFDKRPRKLLSERPEEYKLIEKMYRAMEMFNEGE